MACSISACANHWKAEAQKEIHLIEDGPFYGQEEYQCGPSALAGVLNFYGVHVTPEEISDEIFSKSIRGTFTFDMLIYAQNKGLVAEQYRGELHNLKRNIIKNRPLIVLVNYGGAIFQANHFMVVIGYTKKGFILQSGKNSHKYMDFEDFLKAWNDANNWTLLIHPAPQEKQ